MSASSKGITLRLVMEPDSSQRVLSLLKPTKVESNDVVLDAGRLTTEDLVKQVRDYSRLRDDLLHTIRQLSLLREPRKTSLENIDYAAALVNSQRQLDEARKKLQDWQSRVETLERELEETKKQSNRLSEVAEAGFDTAETASRKGDFNKIIGRLPARKLEAAQRALDSTLKDQYALAKGNTKKDWAYILLAVPHEKTSQALQTLILYDFLQTDIPTTDAPDLKSSLSSTEEKAKKLSTELENARSQMQGVRKETGDTLNLLADQAQDVLMLLKAILRMGDRARVAQAVAWFEKSPSPKTLSSLSAQKTLVEIE